jgi:hypothetical protein
MQRTVRLALGVLEGIAQPTRFFVGASST